MLVAASYTLYEECFPFYDMLRRKAIGGHLLERLSATHIVDDGIALPALPDERNQSILVWVGGRLVPRAYASMSVFDSSVQVRRPPPQKKQKPKPKKKRKTK